MTKRVSFTYALALAEDSWLTYKWFRAERFQLRGKWTCGGHTKDGARIEVRRNTRGAMIWRLNDAVHN